MPSIDVPDTNPLQALMPQSFENVARFNVWRGNKIGEQVSLNRVVDSSGKWTFEVIVRILDTPDNYTQSWSFKDGVQAMNKCLRYTGWGLLLDQSDG